MEKKRSFFGEILYSLRKNILAGLLILIPFGTTIIVTKLILDLLNKVSPQRYLDMPIPGMGILLTLILLYLAGLITRNFIGRSVFNFFENLISKAPIVGMIYRSSKQLITTFSAGGARSYKKVVIIDYPHPGLKVIAFVTGTSEDVKGNKYYQVFVPTTPNPTSGMMEIVPQENAIVTKWTIEEAVKMVVSGGVLVPPTKFDE